MTMFSLLAVAGGGVTEGGSQNPSGIITSSYVTTSSITSTTTTYNHNGVSIGSAASGRRILICAYATTTVGTFAFSSATIGGVSATKVFDQLGSLVGSGYTYTGFYQALVPTGTTADISITYTQNAARSYIGIYNLVGWDGTAYSSGGDPSYDGSGVLSVGSISVPDNGIVFGSAGDAYTVSGSHTFTWSLDTENYEIIPVTGRTASGAQQNYSFATSGITVTATASGTGGAGSLSVIGIAPIV